jgi:hypothetical protein
MELDACLSAATREIQGVTGRSFEYQSVVETLDGNAADGQGSDILQLNPAFAPIDPAVPVVVTENGVVLSTSFVYNPAAIVIVDKGKAGPLPARPRLIRQIAQAGFAASQYGGSPYCKPWTPGLRNIVATWSGGFQFGSYPDELVKLCCFFANEMATYPTRANRVSRSGQGSSSGYDDKLPGWAQRVIDYWRLR